MQEQAVSRIANAVQQQVVPGCSFGVVRTDGKKLILPYGRFTYEQTSQEVKPDTIYDVASITKVVPTSSLALQLIDQGLLSLDDKAITYLPELRNIDADKLTIRHLLTQTVHYDFRLSDHKDKTPTDLLNVIFRTEFKSRPGTNFFYSNATSVLLGLVVERVFDNRLDELAKEHFFDPLKMSRTGFRPQRRFSQNEIVPTEIQGWRGGEIRGEVHDESAFALQPEIVAGSAGLFTTVPDLLQFLRMLLIGGSVDGKQYFTRDMIKQMYTNQLTDLGEWTGLGWELNQPRYMGKHSRYIFGKTGFTGCVIMCDVKKGFGLALLTNFTYPLRRSDPTLINELRSDLADIVYDNLEAL